MDDVELRECKKCKHEKPLTAEYFKPNPSNKGGLGWKCRVCFNADLCETRKANKERDGESAQQRWKRENPEKAAESRDRYRQRGLAHVLVLKTRTPCADCGKQYPPVCMEFDHLPGYEKVRDISAMVLRGYSITKIDAEIAKCEIVCANCHRVRTATRGGWFLNGYGSAGIAWNTIATNDLPTLDLMPG